MSNHFSPPAIPTAADAPQTHPPLIPLTMNIAPSTEAHQDAKFDAKSTQAPDKLKTKILRLPHPSSLNVLPSPTDKWSATTHPIKAWVVGYLGYHIFSKHFYFHQSRVLHTKAFATSTTASTVGNGGKPKGAEALTPKIIAKVWGQNDMIRHNLGGPHGNLDLTRCQLISLACVANNTFHLWLTTTFNGSMIIPDKALQHLPLDMRDILHLIKQNAAAIYVCKPLHSGQD
jgi:hypothetical protein